MWPFGTTMVVRLAPELTSTHNQWVVRNVSIKSVCLYAGLNYGLNYTFLFILFHLCTLFSKHNFALRYIKPSLKGKEHLLMFLTKISIDNSWSSFPTK